MGTKSDIDGIKMYKKYMNTLTVYGFPGDVARKTYELYSSEITSVHSVDVRLASRGHGILDYSNHTSPGQTGGAVVCNFTYDSGYTFNTLFAIHNSGTREKSSGTFITKAVNNWIRSNL